MLCTLNVGRCGNGDVNKIWHCIVCHLIKKRKKTKKNRSTENKNEQLMNKRYLKVLTHFKSKQLACEYHIRSNEAAQSQTLTNRDRLTIIISAVCADCALQSFERRKKKTIQRQRWCRVEESACAKWSLITLEMAKESVAVAMYFDFMAMKRNWTMCISLDFGQDTIVHPFYVLPLNYIHLDWIGLDLTWIAYAHTIQPMYSAVQCMWSLMDAQHAS